MANNPKISKNKQIHLLFYLKRTSAIDCFKNSTDAHFYGTSTRVKLAVSCLTNDNLEF